MHLTFIVQVVIMSQLGKMNSFQDLVKILKKRTKYLEELRR